MTVSGSRLGIVADRERLALTPWNKAYGNKIQHLLYVISLCERNGRDFIVPCDSNLDDIFLLARYKAPYELASEDIFCAFRERSAYGRLPLWMRYLPPWVKRIFSSRARAAAIEGSKRQFNEEHAFLNCPAPLVLFTVKGHFWHYDLMPSYETFCRYLEVKQDLIKFIHVKYPDLCSDTSVAVHLRETDYKTHLEYIYPDSICLDDYYYAKGSEVVEEKIKAPVVYHLFSDNRERIRALYKGKRYVLHDDDPATDWVAMFLAKNIIQSNSSFCWTASLYNKSISVQSSGGHNYYRDNANVPYGFVMPFSDLVHSDGGISLCVQAEEGSNGIVAGKRRCRR